MRGGASIPKYIKCSSLTGGQWPAQGRGEGEGPEKEATFFEATFSRFTTSHPSRLNLE